MSSIIKDSVVKINGVDVRIKATFGSSNGSSFPAPVIEVETDDCPVDSHSFDYHRDFPELKHSFLNGNSDYRIFSDCYPEEPSTIAYLVTDIDKNMTFIDQNTENGIALLKEAMESSILQSSSILHIAVIELDDSLL